MQHSEFSSLISVGTIVVVPPRRRLCIATAPFSLAAPFRISVHLSTGAKFHGGSTTMLSMKQWKLLDSPTLLLHDAIGSYLGRAGLETA
jgi:hypothetical protein